MKPLDPFNIDLEKTTLIEASAGTGKTYTITTLFCRLIAIGYPVESILVVTFTEAAAAELKLRVRQRVFDTMAQLLDMSYKNYNCEDQDDDKNDDHDDDLIQFLHQDQDVPLICQRFSHALNCFDQSPIMTIHSFCMKILKEHAFESSSFFDIELVPDRSMFLNQVSHDFFMTHVNNLDTLFLSYLKLRQITPQSFITYSGKIVSRKDLVIKPLKKEFEDIFHEYRQILKKIHHTLLTESEQIAQLILNHKGVDKRSYAKRYVPAWLEKSCIKLDLRGKNTLFKMTEKGDALYKFTQTRIAQKTKAGVVPPEHELFDLCEKLLKFNPVFENNLISLKIKFLDFFNSEREKIKLSQGVCFFDDLVNDLAAALENQGNQDPLKLQYSVRQNYKACLIDEFQDTDPRQYEIFSRLFSSQFWDGGNTPFFMIGDPKQAIYAFRGGDIFAYLKASRECDQSFTLEKNYRSAPLLVKGINELFSKSAAQGSSGPFLFEQIQFSKVLTPLGAVDFLMKKRQIVPPLQFCFLKRDANISLDRQGFISKGTASKIIPGIVAKDIVSLLESGNTLLNKQTSNLEKISPKDIAVLVRTNKQSQQVQKALSDFNVPSYMSGSGSVFDSAQALDLNIVLWAVYNPGDSSYIRAALCTSVFGFTSKDIIELNESQDLLYQWQESFSSYKETWKSKGFASMVMELLHNDMAFLNANPALDQRGMTNFYHLVELISKKSIKEKLSLYYLLKWYARQLSKELRDEASSRLQSDELRLETDKEAVAIVTIHKSKGLEYPIVYLPYLWEGQRKPPSENISFHDPDIDHGLTLDLGSVDIANSQICFQTEDFAEQRRLLYVALTRASAMCRVLWGGFNTIETSALGSMLHGSNDTNGDKNGCKDDQTMINDLEQIKALAYKSILIEHYAAQSINPFMDQTRLKMIDLSAKKISGRIQSVWKMSSFSGISHTISDQDVLLNPKNMNSKNLNRDDLNPSILNQDKLEINKEKSLITLLNFPKGAGAGDLFHSIFETLDFTNYYKEINGEVQRKFDQFGFSNPDMIKPAETSIREVLATKLVTKNYEFCLKEIKQDQRFNEMEFIFSVNSFKITSIIKALNNSGKSDSKFKTSGYLKNLSRLTTQSLKGFIKGFIDLVIHHKGKWYIVDYKSNYLGHTYEHYSQDAMFDAMSQHHYFLQYYIYTMALHRYLKLRLKDYDYDTHFGGVFYLFIRGMHPKFASKYGVFHDCPAKSAITELSKFDEK